MTYPPAYGSSDVEPPLRPQPVTVAAMVLMLSTLANFGVGLYIAFKTLEYASVSEEPETDRMYAILLGVVAVAVGGALAALSVGILRGGKVSRILVFIVSGLILCCGGISAVSLVAVTIEDGIEEPAQLVTTILAFVNMITAPLTALLVALPSSNRWFREMDLVRRGGFPSGY